MQDATVALMHLCCDKRLQHYLIVYHCKTTAQLVVVRCGIAMVCRTPCLRMGAYGCEFPGAGQSFFFAEAVVRMLVAPVFRGVFTCQVPVCACNEC